VETVPSYVIHLNVRFERERECVCVCVRERVRVSEFGGHHCRGGRWLIWKVLKNVSLFVYKNGTVLWIKIVTLNYVVYFI